MNTYPEWTQQVDLAARGSGGTVMWATDDFFAEKENLINSWVPGHQPLTFGPKGQIYDGWETRRWRGPGEDQAIIRLGMPGVISGVVVDTAFFKGNFPPLASVEACTAFGYPNPEELAELEWETIVDRAPIQGNTENIFPVDSAQRYTHVRLTMHPDGGIARLRVHGEVVPDPALLDPDALDLAALENGAECLDCSDMFFSSPSNILALGRAAHQAEGWETARRRDEGNDWVSVRLAGAGVIRFVELDTAHLHGNSPASATISGSVDGQNWFEVLPSTRLQPDTRHHFAVAEHPEATRIHLDIYPDGGMARLRLFGGLTSNGRVALKERFDRAMPAG